MDNISPKYKITLVKQVAAALRKQYRKEIEISWYIQQWHEAHESWGEFDENFAMAYHDTSRNCLNLEQTLANMPGELLLKVAIDLGVETPDFIPCVPTFRNAMKSSYETAGATFEKAFRCSQEEPDTAIGMANSALESIVKEILKDERLTVASKNTDTLYSLTQSLLKALHLYPGSTVPQEIRTIGTSLLSISQSIEKLRSDKTRFHGHTDSDEIITDPLYAQFVLNSVSTVGLFLLNYYKKLFPPIPAAGLNDTPDSSDAPDELDLPF